MGTLQFCVGVWKVSKYEQDQSFVCHPSPITSLLEREDGPEWNWSLLHESSPLKHFGTYQALSIPHLSPQPPLPPAAAPLIHTPCRSLQDPC